MNLFSTSRSSLSLYAPVTSARKSAPGTSVSSTTFASTSSMSDPDRSSMRPQNLPRSLTPANGATLGTGAGKQLNLGSLPPDLIIRILEFLPVPDLPVVARCSRRLKILAYNDDVYEHKLRIMHMIPNGVGSSIFAVDGRSSGGGGATNAFAISEEEEKRLKEELAAVQRLSSRLKQLPGGNTLPSGAMYLGTTWDHAAEAEYEARTSSTGLSVKVDAALADTQADLLGLGNATTPGTSSPQKITAAIPNSRKIGASVASTTGGTPTREGATQIQSKVIDPHRTQVLRALNGVRPRDAFRNMYCELCPYYLDFRSHQKDSRVFKDHTELVDIASLLRRLRLFSQARFIPNAQQINFYLETTIEWFESMVLGHFEKAYDLKNIPEMKHNALACYSLNGGAACAQLFITKNPIFFDQSFNPSLLPTLNSSMGSSNMALSATSSGPDSSASARVSAAGYALADEFAKFMDHLLTSCKEQATIVGKVFVPQMDAMTAFINKVFEDSIAEYLSSVLSTARDRESPGIYLHTIATAVHCCTQFLEYIAIAEPDVHVQTAKIKDSIIALFQPYTNNYMELELNHLGRRFDAELTRWNKRKELAKKRKDKAEKAADYLGDAEKTQAHKRHVMNAMKTVLYAPMALGKSLALMGTGLIAGVGAGVSAAVGVASNKSATTPIASSQPRNYDDEDDDAVTYYLEDDSMGALVSLELCIKLMHANKEALGRVLVITSAVNPRRLRANVGLVFCKLLQAVGDGHIRNAFESAIVRLSNSVPVDNWTEDSQNAVHMDSLQFFELVHMSDLCHQMIEVYYGEDVKPWIDENDFLSDVMVEKKAFERMSDDNVASGMDKSIQVLINQCDHIMEELHRNSDYNHPESSIVLDLRPTKCCMTVIACLNAHTKLLHGSVTRDTIEVFLNEVGIRLFNVICKNLKKWHISTTGAMQLICDLNRYHQWALSLRLHNVVRLFLVLKEVGNLYLAEGNSELRNLINDAERYQGVLRPEEIHELLAARTDYRRIQKHVESKDCVVM